jgi:hypothetical protein
MYLGNVYAYLDHTFPPGLLRYWFLADQHCSRQTDTRYALMITIRARWCHYKPNSLSPLETK